MSNKSITLVCGFGRCGTSLVMQMLEAGGMPVTGEWPAFETDQANFASFDGDWIAEQHGKAVKALDPHRSVVTLKDTAAYRVIWLNRNRMEQAKSHAKFMRLLTGLPATPSDFLQPATKHLQERQKAFAKFRQLRAPILQVWFEDLLRQPRNSAEVIARFCGLTDVDAMVRAIRPRSPECATGLEMEMLLVKERAA